MAFTQEVTVTPVAIEDIGICLFTTSEGGQAIDYSVQVRRSDDTVIVRTGNLAQHLTAQQINQLQAFMAKMRTKAEDEFLP